MNYVPRDYQAPITRFILENPRCNIFARMGSGKTPATLEAVAILKLFDRNRRTLVMGPKRVAQSVWIEEIEKFKASFGHLSIAAAVGTEAQRIKAVKSDPDILCCNYESMEWLIDGFGDAWPFDVVAADESAMLKGLRIGMRVSSKGKEYLQGQGSKRAHAISKIAHKVRRWINLNGSPAPNGIVDLWGPQWFVDGGVRLGRSFSAFEQRFFRTHRNADGYTQWVPLAHAQKEIEDLIRPVSITIDPRESLGAKELNEHIVYVDLPPKARKLYDAMEKDLFAELRAGVNVEAFSAGSKTNKCLQLANGAVFYDTEMRLWEETHDAKLDALKSVVSEANGEPIMVRYCFTPDRDRILKAFPRFKTLDHPDALADFKAGKLPGIVLHAKSAGHGLSLQANCRYLCDYSSHYNLGEDEQIIERIGPTRQAQIGSDREVYRIRLIARNTIEEHSVIPRIREKMSVQDSLLKAMMIKGS
jgi:SNF2 family DNA or RNA helicase